MNPKRKMIKRKEGEPGYWSCLNPDKCGLVQSFVADLSNATAADVIELERKNGHSCNLSGQPIQSGSDVGNGNAIDSTAINNNH